MDITLKQPEIVKAVRQYLQAQGIVLDGKVMQMSFSSGRAGSGAYANITIEDADIPGFGANDPEPETVVIPLSEMESRQADAPVYTKPVLAEVKEPPFATAHEAITANVLADIKAEAEVTEAVKPEPEVQNGIQQLAAPVEPDLTDEPYPFAGMPEPEAKPAEAAPATEGVKTTSLFMD